AGRTTTIQRSSSTVPSGNDEAPVHRVALLGPGHSVPVSVQMEVLLGRVKRTTSTVTTTTSSTVATGCHLNSSTRSSIGAHRVRKWRHGQRRRRRRNPGPSRFQPEPTRQHATDRTGQTAGTVRPMPF
uniref:Uncharacterized protein n=1 Tax=Anopheles christyi TaxID=43041 RepID=A0A182KC50_9DIPT